MSPLVPLLLAPFPRTSGGCFFSFGLFVGDWVKKKGQSEDLLEISFCLPSPPRCVYENKRGEGGGGRRAVV